MKLGADSGAESMHVFSPFREFFHFNSCFDVKILFLVKLSDTSIYFWAIKRDLVFVKPQTEHVNSVWKWEPSPAESFKEEPGVLGIHKYIFNG